jgi:hypothetical protein
MSVLLWSAVLIMTVQTAAALFFCQVLETYMLDVAEDEEARLKVFEHFGTFTRSFLSMFELTLGNWVPICRTLTEYVSEYFSFVVMIYVLFVTFALIKVVTAVFIFETQKVASTDEELMIVQKDRQSQRLLANFAGVFKEIDDSGDGHINFEEFQDILQDHRVMTWLAALDLDVGHCESLFHLLDSGDGKINFQEFLSGVNRCKGAAKSVDLISMGHQITDLAKHIQNIEKKIVPSYRGDQFDTR